MDCRTDPSGATVVSMTPDRVVHLSPDRAVDPASDQAGVLDELRTLLREAAGEDAAWAARIGAHSRIEDDLGLDSVEVAALDQLLRRRYGPRVDLRAYLAGLDLDELLALTVADLVRLVAA